MVARDLNIDIEKNDENTNKMLERMDLCSLGLYVGHSESF